MIVTGAGQISIWLLQEDLDIVKIIIGDKNIIMLIGLQR